MTETGPNTVFSLCMILRNEAHNLPRSLGPVRGLFDEIVVVDTGSTDSTVELAESYGARVQEIDWPGDFAAARNVSLAAATGDWIMWLDGDNSLTPQGVETLRVGLNEARDSIFWCTEVVVPQGERLIQKRVFPKRPDVFFQGRVHEQLIHPTSFKSVMTAVEIFHWGYADKASAREKGIRNLRLLENMLLENGEDFYLHYQIGRTLYNLRDFVRALSWLNKASCSAEAPLVNRGLWLHAGFLKAQVLERLGQFEQANCVLLESLSQAPDYAPACYGLGRQCFTAGQYEQAADYLKTFLEADFTDHSAGMNLDRMRYTAALMRGRCLEESAAPQQAVMSYQVAARMAPDNPEPLLALAKLANVQGDSDQARCYLTRCLHLAPHHRRAKDLYREVAGRD
jgi:tetratricopeptide (TPR) repeat protein